MIRLAVGVSVLLLLSAVTVGGSAAASGLILPNFTGVADCVGGSPNFLVEADPCSNGGASASTVGAPFATAEASAASDGIYSQGANSALTYYFTIDGPDNGPIRVDISSDLVTRSSNAENTAFASITTEQEISACADTNENLCGRGQFHGVISELDEPGQLDSIHLEAVASENPAFGGTAFASADPLIFIDPADIDASAYSIRVSTDVVNGLPSGVPEPAAWVMVLVGFAGLGAAMRARRRRVVMVMGTV
jgi:hypothetical protein